MDFQGSVQQGRTLLFYYLCKSKDDETIQLNTASQKNNEVTVDGFSKFCDTVKPRYIALHLSLLRGFFIGHFLQCFLRCFES